MWNIESSAVKFFYLQLYPAQFIPIGWNGSIIYEENAIKFFYSNYKAKLLIKYIPLVFTLGLRKLFLGLCPIKKEIFT